MSRTEQITKQLAANDVSGISLEEYLQVSFLELMSAEEVHVEESIMYGGNLFLLHACVSQVNPNQPVEAMRKIV